MKSISDNRSPILVTGSHRSGSTWVGKMLALAANMGYISEPFNVNCRPGLCGVRFDKWFTYVTQENGERFRQGIEDALAYRFDIKGAVQAIAKQGQRYGNVEIKIIQDYGAYANYALKGARPVMKDPLAVFATEWLQTQFGMQVVVMVRHPAAFANSLKKLNWAFPFEDLLQQPLLMRDHLEPWRSEIEDFVKRKRHIVEQAALLWKCINGTVDKLTAQHPEWILIRHEDIAGEPLPYFGKIYEMLGLEFTAEIEQEIRRHSEAKNPQQTAADNPHSIMLDSKGSLKKWKQSLSGDEIARISEIVGDVADRFYGQDDW